MGKQHLLLVDGDAKSLRVMEVSLKKAGFQVTTAVHGKDALEKVQISVPDLVLADTRMPEMDGFDLCKALKANERFGSIPFVFLTNQKSVEFKVRGLEMGADDYLTKPIYIKEIVTRILMILQKAEKERIERRETRGGFAGSLSDMGLVDLVQTFEIGRKTGTLSLQSGRASGTLYFREGKVVDGELGRHTAESAFYRMLNLSEGSFELQFVPVDRPDKIEMSTQGLLMEGMRRLDEWGRMLEQLPPLETIFELDYEQLADRLSEIPDEVNGLLRLFDGVRSVQVVVDDSDFDDLGAIGVVSKLYFEGLIREATPGEAKPEVKPVQDWLKTAAPPAMVLQPVHDELAQAEPELPLMVSPPAAAAPPPARLASPEPLPQVTPPKLALPALAPIENENQIHAAAASPKPAEVVLFNAREARPGQYAELAEQWSGTASIPSTQGRLVDEAKEKLLREWGSVEGDNSASPSLWAGAHAWSPAVFSVAAAPRPRPVEELRSEAPAHPERAPIFGGAAIEPSLPPPSPPELPAEELTPAMRPDRRSLELSSHTEVSPPPQEVSGIPLAARLDRLAIPDTRPRRAALWGGLAGMLLVGTIGFVVARSHRDSVEKADIPLESGNQGQIVERTHNEGQETAVDGDSTEDPVDDVRAVATKPVETKPAPVATKPPDTKPDAVATKPVETKPAPVATKPPDPKPDAVATKPPDTKPDVVATKPPDTKPPEWSHGVPGRPSQTTVASVSPSLPNPSGNPSPGASGRTYPPPRASADPEAQFARLLSQARRSNQAENFRTASIQYRRALALKPDSPEAKAGLGIALVNSTSNQGGYQEAVKLLEDAVRSEGRDARAWLALGMAYQFTAQKPKARDAYQRYLTLEPSGPASGEVRALLKELGD